MIVYIFFFFLNARLIVTIVIFMSGYQRILESQSLALRRVSCSGLTVSEAASENARKCKHFGKESGVTSSGTERDVLGC